MLAEGGGSIAMVVREAEKELNMNKLTDRRDDTSLQGMMTIITAAREAGEEEEEDVTMRAVLLQSINITVSVFNLAFLTVTEAAATS
ncbi:hypothetical protein BDBG_04694 [Blastomyces gilchristii SLH14081]|uniref:Uncharacterized protein n=1 Tax=Blastomyces gilchristii (strain SLH14081) TaxID=559298 RepID=A0A179UPK6_BLAGS|nr:uncharacterized protein BDBG_04694 [Blastomyces gilchristii SLH14081]OAT09139.1 hypothetical protein BDBG_04694 [Blastomyces gilchristii SLH14081]